MSKIFAALILMVFFSHVKVFGDVVQVPEGCAGKISPCLLKAKGKVFNFKINQVNFNIQPETIVKVSHNNDQIDLNILKGKVRVNMPPEETVAVYINLVLLDANSVMASKNSDYLSILSLDKFTLAKYKISEKSVPIRSSEVFLSKLEFIEYTKEYFVRVKEFREFLISVESNWIVEFKRQNESQTKALLRSIASEEKEAEERVKRKMLEEQERKRVKNELFYRTFER